MTKEEKAKRVQAFINTHIILVDTRIVETLFEVGILPAEDLIKDDGVTSAEVMNWYRVTGDAAETLMCQDEITVYYKGLCWWGRETANDPLEKDGVLNSIVEIYDESTLGI